MGGRRFLACVMVATATALSAAPANAAFHEILVREVYAGGASNDSYVVLQAYSGGQNLLGGHSVTAYDAAGTALGTFTFAGSVPNGQNQMTVLVADSAYPTGFPGGPAPNGTATTFNLDPSGGAVCWAGLDCVSWGAFGGTTSPPSGTPADAAGIPAGMALRRSIAAGCPTLLELSDDTDSSAADLQDATPNPRANASPIVESPCPPPTAPNTAIGDPKPPARTNSTEASFTFTATPSAGASFHCRLDDEPAFSACAAPATYTDLAGGEGTQHTFRVRAVHPTNGTDPSPATHTWTVDTVAPVATIDTKPENPSPGASAAFAFHASETSTFQCSLVPSGEPDAYSGCSSVKTYTGLSEGEYTFKVRATDQASNVGVADAHTWEVDDSAADTTPPQTTIDAKPPDPSVSSTAAFAYSSNEPGSTFECALDGAGFAGCPAAGIAYADLGNGSHSFQVRAVDASQNKDPTPAGYTFTVVLSVPAPLTPATPAPLSIRSPAVAPQTRLAAKPPSRTGDRTPTFRFASSPPGASFECQLDRGRFKPCRSPFTTRPLTPGRHTVRVRAVAGGLADASPATSSFTVVSRRGSR